MKKIYSVLVICMVAFVVTGCFSKKTHGDSTYHVAFTFTQGTTQSSIDIADSNIFEKMTSIYDGIWLTDTTTEFDLSIPSSITTVPATFNSTSTAPIYYYDENNACWSATTVSVTVTQITPTIKGTFTATVNNGTTTATLTNGTFEGDIVAE